MSIRKFNGDNGKWAPVLTHVDAVIGWDGKTLTQIIKALEEEIEESGSIEDGSNKEIWEMTPGKFYSKGNKIYLCTRGGNDDYTLPWEAVIIGPPDGIIVKGRHDGLVEGNIYKWTYINNETLQTILGDYCTSEAVGNMFLQKGVTAITFNDSPIPGELGGKDGTESENKTPVYRTVQTSERVHHHQPIRFGLSLRYRINKQWSIESGLTYSRLTADITNTIDGQPTTTEQSLNYIGIPLSASYLLWGNRHFNFYLSAGGLVEKMVKGSRITQGVTNSVSIHPLQISVNGAAGAEFKFTEGFSLYAEPALNYSFDNGSSIPTLYQEKPMNFNITVGVRFNIK